MSNRATLDTPRTTAQPYLHTDGNMYTQRAHNMCYGCVAHKMRERYAYSDPRGLCHSLRTTLSATAPGCAGPWLLDAALADVEVL